MVTKLKDLKFGDYTLKGEKRESYGDSVFFSLSRQDIIEDSEDDSDVIAYDYTVGCGDNIWHFHGASDFSEKAKSIGYYDEQDVLFYDSNEAVWKFEGVADRALGFYERTQGSPEYYQFYAAITPPTSVPSSGSDAAVWIADFISSLNGNNLVACNK